MSDKKEKFKQALKAGLTFVGEQIPFGSAFDLGLGMLSAGWQDKRQLEQQQKLQEMQIAGSKEMARFNQELNLDTWQKTSYPAQMEMIKKAGLSPGLIYGQSGAGGQLGGASGGAPSSPGAASSQDLFALTAIKKAQAEIKGIEAQAGKTEAEKDYISGVQTDEALTRIADLTQGIDNKKAIKELTEVQKQSIEINNRITEAMEPYTVKHMEYLAEKIYQEARSAIAIADIDEATKQYKIEIVEQDLINSTLTNSLLRHQIVKNKEEVRKLGKEIKEISMHIWQMQQTTLQGWERLKQTERETKVREAMKEFARTHAENSIIQTEFNTSDANKAMQWMNLIMEPLRVASGFMPFGGAGQGTQGIGFKYGGGN